MWGIFSSLLDALLPPHRDVRIARAFVKSGIDTVVSPREAGATWISALLPYRDARVRALVRAVKYYGEITALSGAGKILGEYLLGIIAEKQALSGWEEPLLIPIPASRVRVRERGYN
ncbi:hypothetical protein HY090_02275, partial [Candidatus Kaiserbacteria bacterium]|nr:hypothetical protein [Candidatus Kaiserbacteria bacterium]